MGVVWEVRIEPEQWFGSDRIIHDGFPGELVKWSGGKTGQTMDFVQFGMTDRL